jgi:hypothetical protein
MKTKFFLSLLFALFFLNLQAQNREILDNRVLYTKYYASDFFSEKSKWAWEVDVVYRRQSELGGSNIFQHPLRFSVRPWIAYQLTKMIRISYQPFGIFESAPRYALESDLQRPLEREFRQTLQVNTYVYAGRVNITNRLRIESRWRGIDNEEGVLHSFRVRYRIRLRIPINTDYFYRNNTLYTSLYSEAHTEFGKEYGTNYLSQNRNFIGLGYRFWGWTRVELGYLHQYNFRSNNRQIDLSRGPMFYLFFDVLSRNQRKYKYSF